MKEKMISIKNASIEHRTKINKQNDNKALLFVTNIRNTKKCYCRRHAFMSEIIVLDKRIIAIRS